MRKFILVGIVITLLLSWTYAARSQKQDAGGGNSNKPVQETTQSVELDNLAKRIVIQQQESRENLRRLAEGQIKTIEIGSINQNEKQIFIKAFYTDQTSLDGRIDLESVQGKLYIDKVTRLSAIQNLPGQQVATVGTGEMNLGRQLVKSQGENQDIPNSLLKGDITKIEINNIVKDGSDSTTIEAATTFKDGTSRPLKISMTFLNGFWYIKGLI